MKIRILGWLLIITGIGISLYCLVNFSINQINELPQTGEVTIIKKSPYKNLGPVLQLDMEITKTPLAVKILNNNVIEGYATSPNQNVNSKNYEYKISLYNDKNALIWENYFQFPRPSNIYPSDKTVDLKSITTSLNIPFNYQDNPNNLKITSNDGKVLAILMIPLATANKVNSIINNISSQAFSPAAAQNKYSVVIVGDGFSNSQQFTTLVGQINDFALASEPLKMRASQVQYAGVNNTGTTVCPNFDPQYNPVCNFTRIQQLIAAQNIYYNKVIIVLNNIPTFGLTWDINGEFAIVGLEIAPEVALHEMSHELGLMDEYTYAGLDISDSYVGVNCYVKAPPNPVWANKVPLNQYYKGCMLARWYRPSQHSIMTCDHYEYYNSISLDVINSTLDGYAGTFTTSDLPPNSTITQPANNSNQSGNITITSTFDNNAHMHRAELWINDVIQDINYASPFSFTYNVSASKKDIKIEVRAYDALGRVGTYDSIILNPSVVSTNTPVPTNTPISTNTPVPTNNPITNTLVPTNTTAPTYTPLITTTMIPTGGPGTPTPSIILPSPPFTPTVTTGTPSITQPLPPGSIECGPIDVNNDNQLDYIDLYAFIKVYLKTCSDVPPITGCQGKDVRKNGLYDGVINYIDLSSFVSRYYSKVSSCVP